MNGRQRLLQQKRIRYSRFWSIFAASACDRANPEVKLYVNGEYALTFSIGLQREWEWRGSSVRMRYRPVRNEWTSWGRQRQFELEGNSGIYELVVPAAQVTEGQPVRVTVVMQPHPR